MVHEKVFSLSWYIKWFASIVLIMGAGDINIICANLFLEVINNKTISSNLAA